LWTPEFDIQLKIDDEIFFTKHYDSIEGNDSLLRTIETEEPWTAIQGLHTIKWELDIPIEVEGNVEESREDNNVVEHLMEVVWDPAPQFEILTPEVDDTLFLGEPFLVEWTISDSNSIGPFECFLFWSTDTSGWAENNELIYDDNLWTMFISGSFGPGEHSSEYTWNQMIGDPGEIEVGNEVFVAGFASDANQANISFSICPGSALIAALAVDEPDVIAEFNLLKAYPNPFNQSVSIEYDLKTLTEGKLTIYDLSGRAIARLREGSIPAGKHSLLWQPGVIPGGIYLLQLETEIETRQVKLIYMP